MMTLTLSADHRVIDGIVAARFLSDLVTGLESPGMLLY
jgi:pyruvate/2-oxoglutarate dehydrogenase complex dihydrolipoamide acyltransferase (E2) component